MKRRIIQPLAIVMLALMLSACNGITLSLATVPTVTPQIAEGQYPTPPPTSTEAALQCPTKEPKASTEIGNVAPSFQGIINELNCLERNSQEQHTSSYDAAKSFMTRLAGKTTHHWEGWISSIGTNYENKDLYDLHLFMDDPYQDNTPARKPFVLRNPSTEDVLVSNLTFPQISQLNIGQKVRFNGIFAVQRLFEPIAIEKATIEPDGLTPIRTPDTLGDLSDFVVTERYYGCGMWGGVSDSIYTIIADSTVTLETRNCHQQEPPKKGFFINTPTATPMTTAKIIAKMPPENIVELITMVEKTDFFSLSDHYIREGWTDSSYSDTTITLRGRTKTVHHYHGDDSAPRRLILVENKINEIISNSNLNR
jgi:hypothetical protein